MNKTSSVRNSLTSSEVEEDDRNRSVGCGILGRYPIISVVVFAAVGTGIGLGISYWEPSADDQETKDIVIQWVGLIGDLFIRALKAVVLPLIFCNVVLSVVDMMVAQRASIVGLQTIVLYTATTLIASTIGLISCLCFSGLFTEGQFDDPEEALIQLGCNAENTYITELADGSLLCSTGGENTETSFVMEDLTSSFVRATGGLTDISMSDTVYQGVFLKLITDNITFAFVDGNFASVVVFAIVFGVAMGRVMFQRKDSDVNSSTLVLFFREINDVLLMLINWIIAVTPFAVLSLIAKAIGSQSDLGGAFANVGWLIAALLLGFVVHFVITNIILHAVLTKSNPFEYLQHIIPAQTTALACSSSAATLPVTLRCVKNSGMVPDPIRNFVCPLGATINMDGSALYFPCTAIWLAYLNGIQPNAASYILLIILSTVGSAGAAPVPSSGLVMVITAYNTLFGGSGTPNGFEFVVAIDWFIDRIRTAVNVTGDTVVSRVIASRTPEGAFGDEESIETGDGDDNVVLEKSEHAVEG